jgi:hypothetical protein
MHVYTYAMEYYLAIKNELSIICNNMDGHYVKKNQWGIESQIPHVLAYMREIKNWCQDSTSPLLE